MPLMIANCSKCGKRMMVSDKEKDKKDKYFCSRKRCKNG